MLRFLRRIFRESLSLHLLLPLGVSILVGTASGIFNDEIDSWSDFQIFWNERLLELLAIYLTFSVVLVLLAFRETAVRFANIGTLEGVLSDSKEFFAFAAIPLEQWFEPSVQVYLARLVAHQQRVPGYLHERVLLFFSDGDLEAAHASYLNEYYARCLARIHQLYGIRLAFLRPVELYEELDKLTVAERRALGCYPAVISALPDKALGRVRPSWLRRQIPGLAFALVSDDKGTTSVLRFSKGRRVLDVQRITTDQRTAPYLTFAKSVYQRIHRADGSLSPKFDFSSHMMI